MIARLTGKLAEASADTAIIDVGGVGYLVHASSRTLDAIGPVGGDIVILTELQVREDAWTLFGFGSPVERDSFRALTSVQGVGGRLALAILSALSGRRALGTAAMTGEISLRGRVLPVGGIKAKVLAASRAGIERVILPARNRKDLIEVPPEVLEKLEMRFVEGVDDAIAAALEPGPQAA